MIIERFIVWKKGYEHGPVGLDPGSGGYPYITTDPNQIKFWSDIALAQNYCDVMNSGSYGEYVVRPVHITVKDWV